MDFGKDMVTVDVISENEYLLDENPQAFEVKSIELIKFEA